MKVAATAERILAERAIRYDLRTPCTDCPFRRDVPLHAGVGRDLLDGTLFVDLFVRGVKGHTCHKTDPESDSPEGRRYQGPLQHCAGVIISMVRDGIELPGKAGAASVGGQLDVEALDLEADVYTPAELLLTYDRAMGHLRR